MKITVKHIIIQVKLCLLLGNSLKMLINYEKAIQMYNKAIELNP